MEQQTGMCLCDFVPHNTTNHEAMDVSAASSTRTDPLITGDHRAKVPAQCAQDTHFMNGKQTLQYIHKLNTTWKLHSMCGKISLLVQFLSSGGDSSTDLYGNLFCPSFHLEALVANVHFMERQQLFVLVVSCRGGSSTACTNPVAQGFI